MEHTKPQPEPQPGKETVYLKVIDDIRKRAEVGITEYGMPLQSFNGRDPFVDMYQEQLDGVKYLKQFLMERPRKPLLWITSVAEQNLRIKDSLGYPAWENQSIPEIFCKFWEEVGEFIEAYYLYLQNPDSAELAEAAIMESGDVVAVVMMLSAKLNPRMNLLNRGKES